LNRRDWQVRAMRELVDAVWSVFAGGDRVTITEFIQPDGLAEAVIAGLDPFACVSNVSSAEHAEQLASDQRLARGLAGEIGAAAGPPLELPPNIKQCPACNMLIEKV
jgi:queuine/archaeosine tRNA-ribosyltransferase